MNPETIQYIRAALDNRKGDDLERAERAFRGRTTLQMQEQYGQSGRTCQAILDEYRQDLDRHNRIVADFEANCRR